MLENLQDPCPKELLAWIEHSVHRGANIFGCGYQGHTYIYEARQQCLIIKAPSGWGPAKWIRRLMLYNEYRVYKRLPGIEGIPLCYGFVAGRYLVLQYIAGRSLRSGRITDRGVFFDQLLKLIQQMHQAGVAHADLKKKDNLLVVDGRHPWIIDFGVAVVKKSGFAPVNHYLFRVAQKFDYNAWTKLKYRNQLDQISEADRRYYNRTVIESAAGWIKRGYRKIKSALSGVGSMSK